MLLATIENLLGPSIPVKPKDRNPFELEKKAGTPERDAAIDREFAAIHMKRTLNRKGRW